MKWGGNTDGAKITGVGDPLDVFSDLIYAFNAEIINPNFNTPPGEINYKFFLGGNEYRIKYYPSSTSSGEPTISIKKGNNGPTFKMRF